MRQFVLGIKSVMLLCVTLVGVAQAKSLTVPQDYPTIALALKNSEPGDSVFVRAGVYRENIQLVDDVILQGESKENTIIKGSRKDYVVKGADNAVISGFTITEGFAGGILCENNAPIIKGNIISKNRGSGIMAVMALPQIENNIIYANEWTGVYLEASKSLDTKIDHNIILNNGYAGISSNDGSSVLITNNIIYQNKEFGVYFDKESMQSRFEYNNLYGNVLEVSQGFKISDNNIYQDPLLLDGTFELDQMSPCNKMGEGASDIGLSNAVNYKSKSIIETPQIKKPVVRKISAEDKYTDNDNDGIFNADDKCPDEPEDYDGVKDEDGCPDKD